MHDNEEGGAGAPSRRAPSAKSAILAIPPSRIREVANAAMGRADVLAFWFGEPDEVTPAFIRDAAARALNDGDTFYHPNLGVPALREALARYQSRLHRPVDAGRIAITSAGVNGLMLAAQAIIGPGDHVVAVVPLWPNITAMPEVLGARVTRVALRLDAVSGHWQLDLDRLLAAITPDCRAVIVNSPNNPTGWVMPAGQMQALLEHCRRQGTWIVSDEAYERLVFTGARCAPSLLDFASAQDRVIVANTFSKTWRMTGWRLGWLVLPPQLMDDIAKLIEFNTSCAPGFVQQAGIAALAAGDAVVDPFIAELGRRRDELLRLLRAAGDFEVGEPQGAMYAFFRVPGEPDSVALAKRLVRDAGLGLAPGVAFGPEGEGWLRWCFAKPAPMLAEGVRRLKAALG